MQVYRATSAGEPLVSMIAKHIVALDAETGALRWKQPVEPAVTRIVVTAGIVFVAADEGRVSTLLMFDLATGAPRGSIPLPFRCHGALVSGDRIYFAGSEGIFAVRSDGRVMFKISRQVVEKRTWVGDVADLVGHDPTGAELWRMPNMAINTLATYLSVGHDVAQIDYSA